ncbi:c6 zinc finger domain containing protein [Grosmannia clavigera kw1407]|uniref:C6 zinc finger domain containing protein n=1 Tax=Grosmannia clavigera (strain kw1407 / UAMH 11150) TaxID=655863 RepID=F0XBH8_GROCL|nr:c6 zinc finger domain containing protein [Grosmannia clavigera kw1407]EFX04846.1 c6 zinc finger domain containing protein [Grosmannia clavigera kw1407]
MSAKRVPSCEPCRLVKLACDHQHPVCSRCIKRGIDSKCEYRKNAFKRIRPQESQRPSPEAMQSSPADHFQSRCTAAQSTSSSTPQSLHQSDIGQSVVLSQLKLYPSPGFQGPSSLASMLDNLGRRGLPPPPGSEHAGLSNEEASRMDALSMNRLSMIEDGVSILDMLLAVMVDDFLDRVFTAWKGCGLESHLGSFLVSSFVDTMSQEINLLQSSHSWRANLFALSQRIFDRGSQPVELDTSTTLRDFVNHFTGPSLRWETVGVILTLIGIAAAETRAPNAICNSEQERQILRMNMVNCANKCASFCESFDMSNDVQIIFLYQNFLLQSVFYGDQSFKTWHAFNDAANALLAAGLHQKPQDAPNVPFFLLEMRKRIFVRFYSTDITMATFLGRPPRISKRFCTVDLPSDLNETVLSLRGPALETELQKLNADGWNTTGQIHSGTVQRWAMTTSMIREDVLELLLGHGKADVVQVTSALRERLMEAWAYLPSRMVVSSLNVWKERTDREEAECLHLIRLYYLHTAFLIEWAAWSQASLEPDDLFRSATELLAWVNQALVRRESLPKLGFISLAWRPVSGAAIFEDLG